MKKTASIIASVLLIAILASALMINVYAQYTQRAFSTSVYPSSYTHLYPVMPKFDTTDMVIEIQTGSSSSYYVQAVGCDLNGENQVNCTFYDNQTIDHFTVRTGFAYSIPNQIYYRGSGYATFGIKSPTNPGTATGFWGANTNIKYEDPVL